MKKAVRWKSKAYGIFYWHDSAVRWKPEPCWMEDRNLLLYRLYEARFYYPESKDSIKIVQPSKLTQKFDELKKELVTWMSKCSYLEDQVAELLIGELKLEEALKLAQDRSYDKLMAEMDKHGPGCEAGWSLVADCNCEVDNDQVERDKHVSPDPDRISDEDLDLIYARECSCQDKDSKKAQRYHVLTCPLSGYSKRQNGSYEKD